MNIVFYFKSLNHNNKKIIAICNDIILSQISIYLALSLRFNTFLFDIERYFVSSSDFYKIFIVVPLVTILVFLFSGIYNTVIRHVGIFHLKNLFYRIIIYSIILSLTLLLPDIWSGPRSLLFMQPLIFMVLISLNRIVASYIFNLDNQTENKINCMLYGAGSSGLQTLKSLSNSSLYNVCGFIDDNKDKQGRNIDGYKIFSFNQAVIKIKSSNINEIILTMPNLNSPLRKKIINDLMSLNIKIKTVPAVNEFTPENNDFHIKELKISDLLDRSIIFDMKKIFDFLESKTVLITGAGGSIGSELSRQIITYNISRIILLDHSEINLFLIKEELISLNKNVEIISILSSINNFQRLDNIFSLYKPDCVYHAAAYKHVTIVEENIIDGINNNVFGTINLIDVCINYNVKKFTLISTDKAVDPSNVMGLTKRISEIYLRFKASKNKSMQSSIVRFGNVLGSSGSVFNLFSKQIQNKGPITLTHRDVTRYFMTIPESVGLILESSTYKSYGDIYILDMGEPIKIFDLAKKMISLSGLTLRDKSNLDGDIKIEIIGLKKGEKLHEKLAMNPNLIKTNNKFIMLADEDKKLDANLDINLKKLKNVLETNDNIKCLNILSEIGKY